MTFVHPTQTVKLFGNILSQYGSPIILGYQHQTFSRNSDGLTPYEVAKYRWGIKIMRFSTKKSLYLANDTKYRHSYYGRRIGTRMRSNGAVSSDLERTLTLFSRSLHSDAKYLINGYRYGHSYYTLCSKKNM